MKPAHLLLIGACMVIFACNSKPKTSPNIDKTVLQSFTDTTQKDTFKISLKGKETKDMKVLFTITTSKGVQVYKLEITATNLLKSYLASEDLKKEEDKIKFLHEWVNVFLDEEAFLVPAITDQEKPDNNVPDIAFYNELKQTQLNGFAYSLGKDKKIYIGWSVKDQKVKIYYKCC